MQPGLRSNSMPLLLALLLALSSPWQSAAVPSTAAKTSGIATGEGILLLHLEPNPASYPKSPIHFSSKVGSGFFTQELDRKLNVTLFANVVRRTLFGAESKFNPGTLLSSDLAELLRPSGGVGGSFLSIAVTVKSIYLHKYYPSVLCVGFHYDAAQPAPGTAAEDDGEEVAVTGPDHIDRPLTSVQRDAIRRSVFAKVRKASGNPANPQQVRDFFPQFTTSYSADLRVRAFAGLDLCPFWDSRSCMMWSKKSVPRFAPQLDTSVSSAGSSTARARSSATERLIQGKYNAPISILACLVLSLLLFSSDTSKEKKGEYLV